MTTTITLYLATLKATNLDISESHEGDLEEHERIFDEHSEAYIDYVRGALACEGFKLEEANEHAGLSYTVEADNEEEETLAHRMMTNGQIMGFWEFYN